MSALWYVRLSGQIVGWVIAADRKEACAHALVKFPTWDFEPIEVEPRRKKRAVS